MSKKLHEILGVPPEYGNDGAPEYSKPPDEFNRDVLPEAEPAKPSRMRRIMLILAAVGLVTVGAFTSKRMFPLSPAITEATAAASESPRISASPLAADVTATPMQTATQAATFTTALTETPQLVETPTLEPTPKVTPIPTPGVDVSYYYRSSQVYFMTLIISMPEQITSVSFRLKAPDTEESALEIELTPQQIEDSFYSLRVGDREEGFDASEFFAHHPEADLVMDLTYTVQTGTGEETHTETFEPAAEDWIYWRYDSEEDVGGIGEMMFGTVFPGCFVVRIYESQNQEQQLTVGDDAELLNNGDVSISISIEGREIPDEAGNLYSQLYRYADDDTIYCDYALVISIPEDFPQHGTATMTLTRKLIHSDTILIRTKTIDY